MSVDRAEIPNIPDKNAPINIEDQTKKHFKMIPPSSQKISAIFKEIGQGNVEIPQKKLDAIKQGVAESKELIGYDLICLENTKLTKWRTLTEATQLTKHMESLGYTEHEVVLNESQGSKPISVNVYWKENYQMVHAVDPSFVKKGILPDITNEKHLKDESWLLNKQDKLCVSVIKPGGKFYHSKETIAVVLKVNPKSIIDIFSQDKLTPTGYRRMLLKTTVEDSKKPQLAEEQIDVENVKKYIKFQKNYRLIVNYSDSIAKHCLAFALENPDTRDDAMKLLTGLDNLSKEIDRTPLGGKFDKISARTQRLEVIKTFILNHSAIIDTPDHYKQIFSSDDKITHKKSTIAGELDNLIALSTALDDTALKYKNIVHHRKASEWGPKHGHQNVEATTAYMQAKVQGRSALTSEEKEKHEPYNELNIEIPKLGNSNLHNPKLIDIAGLMVDTSIFDRASGKFMIDVEKTQQELVTAKKELANTEKSLKTETDPTKLALLKKERKHYDRIQKELECKLDFVEIAKQAQKDQIPILLNRDPNF